jgi:hypothetical protein
MYLLGIGSKQAPIPGIGIGLLYAISVLQLIGIGSEIDPILIPSIVAYFDPIPHLCHSNSLVPNQRKWCHYLQFGTEGQPELGSQLTRFPKTKAETKSL